MFRHLWHHVTGMVRTLRQRVQQVVWALTEQTYRYGIHAEADETEAISWTSSEESQAGLSAVS